MSNNQIRDLPPTIFANVTKLETMWVLMDGVNDWIIVREDYPLLLINNRFRSKKNKNKKGNDNNYRKFQKMPNVKYE